MIGHWITGHSRMEQIADPLAILTGRDATQVGNYFVANYPPFSVWQTGEIGCAIERLGRRGCSETSLGLYVHLPFCRKRCDFCYFRVYTDKNHAEIEAYLEAVLREAELVGRQPFLEGRHLDFIYFGGGTPSYLSGKQLGHLMSGLRAALPWNTPSEVAFECEPGTLSERKLETIRSFGVNRLSLGVENFDDAILACNNRAHRSKEIYRAWEWLERTGFEQVNLDLIAGMIGETDAKWHRTVEETVRLAPDAVTVYQMEIPFNTTIYKEMRRRGSTSAPVADWSTKRRWTREAFDALEANGYSIGSAYTAVRDSSKIRFVYRDQLWDGADMLALGVSAFGYLDGVHYQNQPDLQSYLDAVAKGALPILRALSVSAEEAMIRQFVLKMKLGHLETRPFRHRFGVDVVERWRDLLTLFRDHGLLTFDSDRIDLTRHGLLQVDRLLHAFFLPEHTNIRYA